MSVNAVNPAAAAVKIIFKPWQASGTAMVCIHQTFFEMPSAISIQNATAADFDAVCALLSANNLPSADLNPLLDHFLVALEEGKVVAVMGIDRYGMAGLLRSAAVSASHRNAGLAAALLQQLLETAKQTGIAGLYLITNTAENYFSKKGFVKISRELVPAAVLQSEEFNGLCPASSVIMHRAV